MFLCPSDGQLRVDPTNWGGTNYVSNSGTGTINSGNFNVVAGAQLPDGPFYNTSAIRFAAITDGLSNTAGYSETIMGNNITTNPGSGPPANAQRQFALFNETTITNIPPALFLPPNMFFRSVSHRTRGRATGAANGRAAASSWRRITISTLRTASIRIAPTTAETRP